MLDTRTSRHPVTGLPPIELEALGTRWFIEPLGAPWGARAVRTITQAVLDFEKTYTRFTDTSLLGSLNKHKILHRPPSEMLQMLRFAQNMQTSSNGVFNISVGGELVRLGYGQDAGTGNVSDTFWDEVVLTSDKITIPDQINLDFGGFGKGWLIDKLDAMIRSTFAQEYIINGGGDILVRSTRPIELALEHPHDPTMMIGTTRIMQGALAVSSPIKRSWKLGGHSVHHIIDPRKRRPSASPVVSAYVRSTSALIADVCATVLIIEPKLERRLAKKFDIQSILI
ncbi:FAD:protein FMN transferase [Candidatus Saccharibacteria bacterium]|nr:FAD:protein FMN transferase [Candidatus Saccharibacteria bacterium]